MLPEFPEFKNLELADKEDVEFITKKYPPYSDFNFISMWSWDIKHDLRLSILNGNLVVKFTDYITGKPFYSFLGDNEVNDTIEKLLELSKKEGLEPILKLVPEASIKNFDKNKFKVEEDRDNFDYVYDIDSISEYKGAKFSDKRTGVNHFVKKFTKINISILDFDSPITQEIILKLNDEWLKHKIDKDVDFKIKNELLATKIFLTSKTFNTIGVGIFNEKKLIGYSIFEKLPEGYSICHFCKADTNFERIYDYLMKEGVKILKDQGCHTLNYEQDLGIPGLRYAKTSFRPINFLKKMVCTYKS